jgi:outer membrane receptor protein involved in Fe transport
MISTRIRLRATVATASILVAGVVHAQTAAPAPSEGEIVVTATKQSATLSRVPISLTAVTQKTLDEQGVKNIGDIARTVPALTLQRSGADSAPNIAIRGIYSTAGAPTTGIYLDDVPLQKRNALSFSGNGSPIPQIFDLERVEVLRGPQGTLYGGSSEGGTVRFITPQPSLDKTSAYGRAELAFTKDGAPTTEAGVAVGGPLIKDKLGIRISLWDRETGGYIDHVDLTDPGKVYSRNTNWDSARNARIALKWQATDNLSFTPSFYYSYDKANDVDTYWQQVVPATTAAYSRAATLTNPGYSYASHAYPAATQYGPYVSGNPYHSPRTTQLYISSLSTDWNAGFVNVKSITSYVHDTTVGVVDEAGFNGEARNLQAGVGFVAELPNFDRQIRFGNRHNGLTEELRFSSPNPNARFSWVGGLYYSYSKIRTNSLIYENLDQLVSVLRGQTTTAQYGAPLLPGNLASVRYQTLTDKEYAAFGEAYYRITDKLKLTAGVRVSRTIFDYDQTYYGALAGFSTPTYTNAGLSSGNQKATPITPKAGITWQVTPDDMLYASASKGYRTGGVNPTVSQTTCAAGLALYGGNPPTTYKSDSVWSYEAGTKSRMLNGLVSVQASGFYIDWKSPQLFETFPGCSAQFTTNAGHATSRGGDVQVQLRPSRNFNLSVQASYTDAHYTGQVLGPTPVAGGTQAVIAQKGDQLPVAPWNVNVSAQWSFAELAGWKSYIRGDFQYASRYHRTTGPGTVAYAPEQYNADSTRFVTARLGATRGPWELSLFVDNLLNSTDTLAQITGGRGTCRNTACTSYAINEPLYIGQTFRPRTIGLQAAFRY